METLVKTLSGSFTFQALLSAMFEAGFAPCVSLMNGQAMIRPSKKETFSLSGGWFSEKGEFIHFYFPVISENADTLWLTWEVGEEEEVLNFIIAYNEASL